MDRKAREIRPPAAKDQVFSVRRSGPDSFDRALLKAGALWPLQWFPLDGGRLHLPLFTIFSKLLRQNDQVDKTSVTARSPPDSGAVCNPG
jgi:hypothetical protein